MLDENRCKMIARALEYLLTNADLTKPQREEATAALGYANDCINGDLIMSIWTTDDVKSLVDDDEIAAGIAPVTDEEARAVLKNADHYHDASVGINWEVLETHLDMVRRGT